MPKNEGLKGLSGLLKGIMQAFSSLRNKIQIMTFGGHAGKKKKDRMCLHKKIVRTEGLSWHQEQ